MAATNGAPRWVENEFFSTGEAAEVCRVSQQTIIRCFDTGRLKGFRIPGSRFRRIPRHELLQFMLANAMPTRELEGNQVRGLIVSEDPLLLALAPTEGHELVRIDRASTPYEAGRLIERHRPRVVLLDESLPDRTAEAVCRFIKADPDTKRTRVFIVLSDPADRTRRRDLVESGADGIVRRPLDSAGLLRIME